MQVLENKLLLPIMKFKKISTSEILFNLFRRPKIYIKIEPDIYKEFDPIANLMERGNYEKRIF